MRFERTNETLFSSEIIQEFLFIHFARPQFVQNYNALLTFVKRVEDNFANYSER